MTKEEIIYEINSISLSKMKMLYTQVKSILDTKELQGSSNNQEEFEENMILNMGQLLSIPFVIFGIYLIIRSLKHPIDTGAIIYKKH